MTRSRLRVVDAGDVGAYRSQALWHGIASAMRPEALPTLSFCRPIEPYVGLGYHRSLQEIDLETCQSLGLPVIRRRIGGGPVYLDADQLFFQITLPADRAPARIDRLYEQCLEPAAEAFRALGLAAWRNGVNDIAVGDTTIGGQQIDCRKVSGTGAGRLGDGVTVVGNVMFRFPHERMVEVLALAGERLRQECLRLMKRHVSSLAAEGLEDVGFGQAREALVEAYSRVFGSPVAGPLSDVEEAAIQGWIDRFQDPAWLAGPGQPPPAARQIKISADAWVVASAGDGVSVEASIVAGNIERVRIEAPSFDADAISHRLVGSPARPAALRRALEPFGEHGSQVLKLLEPLPPLP